MARRKLTIGDFQNRFEIEDDNNKLFYDGKPLATEVGLKKPEFTLAVLAFFVAVMSCIASWVSACNKPPQSSALPVSPSSVSVSPVVNVTPMPLTPADTKSVAPRASQRPKQPCNCSQVKATP